MMCGCDAATEWEDGYSYDEKKCVKCPAGFANRAYSYNYGANRCFKCPTGEEFRQPSDGPGCFATCAAGQMEEKPEVKIASCSDGLFQRIYSTICYECPARTDKIEYSEGSYKCIPEATYACIECAQGSLMCMEGACACYETPTTGQLIEARFAKCCNDGSCQDATRTNNLLEQDLIVSDCPNGAGSMMCGCNASTGWEDWYEKRCIKCPAGFEYNYRGANRCIKCPAGEEFRWPSDGPNCFATCALGYLTETQMFKIASCSEGHVLENAWEQATEYGTRFFCYDCPAGTRYVYRLGDGTTQCEIPSDESHCLQQFGNSQRKECKSTDNSNKMVAELLKYFSGDSTQSAENFGFCLPQLSFPDDIDSIIAETEDLESVGTTLVYTISALEPYIGVLAGVTDQPSIVFAFPPPASYTWPQDSERRVQWASFNLPAGTTVTLRLMQGSSEISGQTKLDMTNDMNEPIKIARTVPVAQGYKIELCASTGQCWKSGTFSIKAKIANQPAPVEHIQIMPGDASILTPGSEAYGVYVSGVKTAIAMILAVESHRIEIYGLQSITTTRRASGVQVLVRIHADDTGRDTTSNEDLLAAIQDDDNQRAFVATSGDFMTAAQSSDPNVSALTGDEYSDTDALDAIKEACAKGNCVLGSEKKTWWNTARIVGIAVGATGFLVCFCGGAVVAMMYTSRRNARKNQEQLNFATASDVS